MKILAVDDSSTMRKIIKKAVDSLGYGFLEADNGKKALETLQKHHQEIALVLLDWNLPTKDGYATLEEIKKDVTLKHIPVMMVTTESEKANIVKALKAGATHYVTKPFTHETLLNSIKECLGKGGNVPR